MIDVAAGGRSGAPPRRRGRAENRARPDKATAGDTRCYRMVAYCWKATELNSC